MGMDLPDRSGTYILIVRVEQAIHVTLGRLGDFELVPGYYLYVGSACGEGGIRDQIDLYRQFPHEPTSHVDILLSHAELVEVWYSESNRRLAGEWAELLATVPGLRQPLRRFGSSEYHRSHINHLFYSKKAPRFQWFRNLVRDWSEDAIEPACCPMTAHASR